MTAWLAALAVDWIAGEPPAAAHPVVWIGRIVDTLRGRAPAGAAAELRWGALLVAVPAAGMLLLSMVVARLPGPLRWVASVYLLKSAFSLRGLVGAGESVARDLERGSAAGGDLRALVSRPVAGLDDGHVASAACESLAENLNDSYVAPLLFYVALGLPGALVYRVVNTADAMVGYRGELEWLGKVAAKTDDALGYLPARVSALALAAAAPAADLDGANAIVRAIADHRRTESPNSGWPMAAAAGALDRSFEKIGHYRLGEGCLPDVEDIRRTSRLVLIAAALVSLVALGRR